MSRAGVITIGVDVQGDRIEIEVVGWGVGKEPWSIAHEVIEADANSFPLFEEQ